LGMEDDVEKDKTRRRLAIMNEVMHCPENHCIVDQEGLAMGLVGGMGNLYECLDPLTMERSRGRTMVDENGESSPHCSKLVFDCIKPDEEDYCDGNPGDVMCMCEEGFEKIQIMESRRRTAIMNEAMYCPEYNCVTEIEKEEDVENMMVGGMQNFMECLDMKTGETMEGRTGIETEVMKEPSPYCADIAFICEPFGIKIETEVGCEEPEFTGCDEHLDDVQAMILCLKKEIAILTEQQKEVKQTCESADVVTDTCEDHLAALKEILMKPTEGETKPTEEETKPTEEETKPTEEETKPTEGEAGEGKERS